MPDNIKDLFEFYELRPPELDAILLKYEDSDNTYDVLNLLLKEVESIGFTFEFGLDAIPYDLRAIEENKTELTQAQKDTKRGDTLRKKLHVLGFYSYQNVDSYSLFDVTAKVSDNGFVTDFDMDSIPFNEDYNVLDVIPTLCEYIKKRHKKLNVTLFSIADFSEIYDELVEREATLNEISYDNALEKMYQKYVVTHRLQSVESWQY